MTAHAVASLRPPQLALPGYLGTWNRRGGALSTRSNISDELPRAIHWITFNHELVYLATCLNSLSPAFNEWYDDTGPNRDIDPIDLQNNASLLTCRLIQWLDALEIGEYACRIQEAICIVLIIFTVSIAECAGQCFSVLHFTAVPRLRKAITAEGADHSCVDSSELRIWLWTIGMLAAKCSGHEEWFVKQWKNNVDSSGIRSYDQLLSCVKGFPWVEYKFDDLLYKTWEDTRRVER